MKKRMLFIGISLLILALLVWYANPVALADIVAKSTAYYLALAFAVATVAICVRVLKWQVLLKGVGFRELFPIQTFGLTISNFTPVKIAEPLKVIILKARKGTQIASSLPSVIWERIMDVVVLIIFGLLALLLFGFQTKTVLELSVLSIGAFVVLIVLLLFVLYNKKFGFRLFQSLRKLPLIRRLPEDFMKNFYDSKIKTQKLSFSFILTVIA